MTDGNIPVSQEGQNKKPPVSLEAEKLKLERFKVWGKIITVTITVLFGSALGAYMNWSYQNRQLDLEAMKHLGGFVDYALVEDSKRRFRFAEYFANLSPSRTFKTNWENYRKLIEKTEQDLIAKKKELEAAQQVKDYLKENNIADFAERLRVAQFFADFPAGTVVQEKWREYRDKMNKLKVVIDEKEKKLAEAKKARNDEQARLLETGLALIKEQLKILPEKQVMEVQMDVDHIQAQLSPLPEESTDYLTTKKAQKLYLDKDWKPRNYTENKFEEKTIGSDTIVIDSTTGLTWEQSGSEKYMLYDEAKSYIAQLNHDKFAGFSNWRLPTLEEAITLLEQKESSNGLFIDPVFDKRQEWIWTSDLSGASRAWVVYFQDGCFTNFTFYDADYVRAVR